MILSPQAGPRSARREVSPGVLQHSASDAPPSPLVLRHSASEAPPSPLLQHGASVHPRMITPRTTRPAAQAVVQRLTSPPPSVMRRERSPSPDVVVQVKMVHTPLQRQDPRTRQDELSKSQKLLSGHQSGQNTPKVERRRSFGDPQLGQQAERRKAHEVSHPRRDDLVVNQKAVVVTQPPPKVEHRVTSDDMHLQDLLSPSRKPPVASSPSRVERSISRERLRRDLLQLGGKSWTTPPVERPASREDQQRCVGLSMAQRSLTTVQTARLVHSPSREEQTLYDPLSKSHKVWAASVHGTRGERSSSRIEALESSPDLLSVSQRSWTTCHTPQSHDGSQDLFSMGQRSGAGCNSSKGLRQVPPIIQKTSATVQPPKLERLAFTEDLHGSEDLLSVSQRSCATETPKLDNRNLHKDTHDWQDDTSQKTIATPHMPINGLQLQMEVKELRSVLEKQYAQRQQLGENIKLDRSAEEEQFALRQRLLVEKAASAAPDSNIRELCAMLACQQVEQEMFLRSLRGTVDALQQQVQRIWHATLDKQPDDPGTQKHEPKDLGTCQDDLKSIMEQETKQAMSSMQEKIEGVQEKIEDRITRQEELLKGWISDFFICAMKEAVGNDLARHDQAIKALNLQMDDMNAITKSGLSSLEHLIGVASLHTHPSPEDPSQSSDGSSREIQSTGGELHRNLHTIVEARSEALDPADHSEIESWVKVMYQDIVNQSSLKLAQMSSPRSDADNPMGA